MVRAAGAITASCSHLVSRTNALKSCSTAGGIKAKLRTRHAACLPPARRSCPRPSPSPGTSCLGPQNSLVHTQSDTFPVVPFLRTPPAEFHCAAHLSTRPSIFLAAAPSRSPCPGCEPIAFSSARSGAQAREGRESALGDRSKESIWCGRLRSPTQTAAVCPGPFKSP